MPVPQLPQPPSILRVQHLGPRLRRSVFVRESQQGNRSSGRDGQAQPSPAGTNKPSKGREGGSEGVNSFPHPHPDLMWGT